VIIMLNKLVYNHTEVGLRSNYRSLMRNTTCLSLE
jgi:hypothetical protein